jgi:hypothetical protein
VILFAPFSWELVNYGFFWPENVFNYIITFSGLLYFIINWNYVKNEKLQINLKSIYSAISFVLFLLYLVAPLIFFQEVYDIDNHFVKTLKSAEDRKSKYVELDRKSIFYNDSTNSHWIQSFNHDLIELSEIKNIKSTRISVRGYFDTNNRIKVIDFHENWDVFRDGASYLGLTLILLVWVLAIKRKWT